VIRVEEKMDEIISKGKKSFHIIHVNKENENDFEKMVQIFFTENARINTTVKQEKE
jgi:hypothetical protein